MIVLSTAILGCIVLFICFILPPSLGKIKPFLDENGDILKGSISEKIHIKINDTSLGMFIITKDDTNPVLLFLGGGPGIPEYLLEQLYPSGLENNFIVCYLEYRGTSLSYNQSIQPETMTTEQYISDIVEVTKYLSDRFKQNKIYLLCHSFGTYIGLQTVTRYPNLYHAYIAMAQSTNQQESEKTAYRYMLEQYRSSGNAKMIKKFEKYPILTSDEAYQEYFTSSLRDTAMHSLGVGTMRNMQSVISGIFFPSLRCGVYTPRERINIWRGKTFAQATPIVKDSRQFDAFNSINTIAIPIFFLAGRYDYTCCYNLQKEYYDKIQAPLKGFYTFENSAHSPLFEEPEKAKSILLNDVILGKNILSDFY